MKLPALVLALPSALLGACRSPSREQVEARIIETTQQELAPASLETLIQIADRRGIDVTRARGAQVAAAGQRAQAESDAKKELTAAIGKNKAKEEGDGTMKFYGLNFGIAPTVLFGGPEEVRSATIVDQGGTPVVHVTESRDATTAVLLETHYFFQLPDSDIFGLTKWGFGPFLGVQVSEDDVLQGIGFGAMVGFRYNEESSRSFNIGLGMFLDEDVQTLASGFSDGAAPPGGETQVRYDKEDAWRGALMFSFAWGI